MKNIKTFEQYTNEEINWKKAVTGAALGAGMMFGSPQATGQEIVPIEGRVGVDEMEEGKSVKVNDMDVINNFEKMLEEPKLQVYDPVAKGSVGYQLVEVHEMMDEYSNVFILKLRKPNSKPGEELKVYVNLEDYNKYIETGQIDNMILYQFRDLKPSHLDKSKKFGL